MARKRSVDRLLADDRVNCLLSQISPGARWTYVAIVHAIAVSGDDASSLRLRSGSSTVEWIATWARISQTEAETHADELRAVGLLTFTSDGPNGGGIEAPQMRRCSLRKAEAARINGLKGGRPRKKAAAAAPQPSLMLPIAGDGVRHAAAEPEKPTQLAIANRDSKLKLSSCADDPVDEAEYRRVGRLAREAAGLETGHYGIVRKWLQAGATCELILNVIQRRARPGIAHLGYFGAAIMEAVEREAQPASAPTDLATMRAEAAWEAAIQRWWANGQAGPMPELRAYRTENVGDVRARAA